jgi:hypothetical protein
MVKKLCKCLHTLQALEVGIGGDQDVRPWAYTKRSIK